MPRVTLARTLADLPRRAPVAFSYGVASLAGCLARVLAPDAAATVLESGDLWRTLVAPIVPPNLLPHAVATAFLLLLAWHLEPRLSLGRALLLLFGSTGAGAAWYVLGGSPVPPVGGAFILSAYAAAFFTWFVRSRAVLGSGFRVSWAMPPIALLNLLAIGPALAAASVCAFAVGSAIGLTAERGSA